MKVVKNPPCQNGEGDSSLRSFRHPLFCVEICYTLSVASSRLARKGGVYAMEDIALSFLLSVLAGIIANYISKWLDEREKGNKPEP